MIRNNYLDKIKQDNNPISALRKFKLLMNEVFDDFESRTCGSCEVMDCKILGAVSQLDEISIVNFGCNNFKRKNK